MARSVLSQQLTETRPHFCAGVIQMNGGIVLSYLNQRYFRDSLSTYCEFIPQMIFLNGLFGYLCLLIVGKWISGSTADLYHVMIYMFLSPGTGGLACKDATGKLGCPENIMFTGQGPLQVCTLTPPRALMRSTSLDSPCSFASLNDALY
jgi:hypothetical protein